MNADDISVISLPDVSSNGHLEEKKEAKPNSREDMKVSYWNILYLFAILAFCTVYGTATFLIPRSNSIFYQSH